MTYNVLMGTENPTHSLTHCVVAVEIALFAVVFLHVDPSRFGSSLFLLPCTYPWSTSYPPNYCNTVAVVSDSLCILLGTLWCKQDNCLLTNAAS